MTIYRRESLAQNDFFYRLVEQNIKNP